MKNRHPFHPLLFAVHPVLFLAAHNAEKISANYTVVPLAVTVGMTILAWTCFALFLRNVRKGALATSLFLLLFFSYGHAYDLWRDMVGDKMIAGILVGPNKALFPLWCCLFLAGLVLLARAKTDLVKITLFANAAGVALVAISLFSLTAHAFFGPPSPSPSVRPDDIADARANPSVVAPGDKQLARPNIYYILLDGYARADVLEQLYGLDNEPFLSNLRQRGFYIASRSRANYDLTSVCVPSILNFDYLQALRPGPIQDARDLIAHNKIAEELRARGYRTVAYTPGYPEGDWKTADVTLSPPFSINEFQSRLLNTTPIPALYRLFRTKDTIAYRLHRERIAYVFDGLPETARWEGPLFIFAHILAPHPPFVFNREGKPVESNRRIFFADGNHFFHRTGATKREYIEAYKEQLIFINTQVEKVIASILANSSTPPVIILQSDHGARMLVNWENVDETCLAECFANFSAFYFPDRDYSRLYDDISPVNTFRVVLNQCFETEYEMLENRCYYSPYARPFDFTDVTEKVEDKSCLQGNWHSLGNIPSR